MRPLAADFSRYLGMERGLAKNTCQAYSGDVEHFLAHCEARKSDPVLVEPTFVENYLWTLKKERGLGPASIFRKTEALRAFYRGESDRLQRLAEEKLALVIEPQAWAIGRTLGELALAGRGVVVEALRRRGVRAESPEPDTVVQADDVLILVGARENLSVVESLLLAGTE